MPNNYGLDLEREIAEQSHEDWVFGAESQTCIALIPEALREQYLPIGEVQRGKEDFQDCATRSPINKAEVKYTYLYTVRNTLPESLRTKLEWLNENGYVVDGRVTFSDRFIAIKSGTDRKGNSLKAPFHAMHAHGLIPKAMFPAGPEMTWDEYHDASKITPQMVTLGQEFLRRFNLNYERVYLEDFNDLIIQDMIGVAGYAWPRPENGEYPKTDRKPNHAFLCYRSPRYFIFDNYIDKVDGDYIKKLATDFELVNYGYRLFISENNQDDRTFLLGQFLALLQQYYELLYRKVYGFGKTIGIWT